MTIQTVTVPVCEECQKRITNPNDGRIIIGDIFTAAVDRDGNPQEGLVGPSFPTPPAKVHGQRDPDDWEVNYAFIRKHCYCMDCLMEKLLIPNRPIDNMREFFDPDKVILTPGSEAGSPIKGVRGDAFVPGDETAQKMSEDQ